MTPAVDIARKSGIAFELHSYEHDPAEASFGLEAAVKLNVSPSQVFKTLVVQLDAGELAVAVLPVNAQLSMKAVARALGGKKAKMAAAADVERSTGYVLGGVSPLGQKKRLRTVIDDGAEAMDSVYVSAGKRGLEISLSPRDLASLTNAVFASVAETV